VAVAVACLMMMTMCLGQQQHQLSSALLQQQRQYPRVGRPRQRAPPSLQPCLLLLLPPASRLAQHARHASG
jgi:hypothetical protein